MKLRDDEIEDLTDKSFRIIIDNGKDGMLQSKLWKELDLTSRDASRVAIRLEKRCLIKRKKILNGGRWTYKLFAIKLPVNTECIEQVPCLTCPVEHMCSVDATYSPNNCSLIEGWALLSFQSSNKTALLKRQNLPEDKSKERQIVVTEPQSTKHLTQGLAKNNSNKKLGH